MVPIIELRGAIPIAESLGLNIFLYYPISILGNMLPVPIIFLFARKVLSKLEGRFEEYVKNALKQLLTLINKTYGAGVFKHSEKEINGLIRKL